MTELLPIVQSQAIGAGLLDYLVTTFALADSDAQAALDQFLSDPESGMFKGPYVRLRLPFRPAAEGWQRWLEWNGDFRPYGHQAAAFARLSSSIEGQRRRPQPTLVTTGTGSGKTEAFLYPILDHVLRARRDGITGTKALILYPMNALANDQAARLTSLITTRPELAAVTAGLYVGQTGPTRTRITADGLITDRGVMQDQAPDILLTNYKMLDQLLLRAPDQEIWRQSAMSLQYLVLDEFHTYDGAQGTDVAMLLRRLGLALKSFWGDDDASISAADRARPLGRITPVATSATLGDKGDPAAMVEFARTVFGEDFDDDAVVTESRLTLEEWVGDADRVVAGRGLAGREAVSLDANAIVAALDVLGADPEAAEVASTVLRELYEGTEDALAALSHADPELLLAAVRAHPLLQRLVVAGAQATDLEVLAGAALGGTATRLDSAGRGSAWTTLIRHVVATIGYIRALVGRDALSVDVHLWVRELTRIDRVASAATEYLWSDDGAQRASGAFGLEVRPAFPAVYCRHCGRSGWGVSLAPVGLDLAGNDETIRRDKARGEGRFRALLHAPTEGNAVWSGSGDNVEGLAWFSVRSRTLLPRAPEEGDPELREGWVLPVLTTVGADADTDAKHDDCPCCGQADGIRFLGSAIATLLSVSLSTLFGTRGLDPREKKALVFTDSVQDAAHRAGFVQARSHVLTFRAVLADAASDGAISLEDLVSEVVRRAGDDPMHRYRLLAPDCADWGSFEPFWKQPTLRAVPTAVRRRVTRRLALDAALEFGLRAGVGRTLERTGTVVAEVDAGAPEKLASLARTVLEGFELAETLDASGGPLPDRVLVRWVRGVLERMRTQGGIDHEWLQKYREEDGSLWWLTGGRRRGEGMPGFSRESVPAFPRVGGTVRTDRSSGLDPVTSPQSWYARWTCRALPVSVADGGRLARLLLERLSRDGILLATPSVSGGQVYSVPASRVVVAPTRAVDLLGGRHQLVCPSCRASTPGSLTVVDQLAGGPCLTARCSGTVDRSPLQPGFYRQLYASPDMRRIVAREHTGMLDDETRLRYETGFKQSQADPQAPNVLVATPTLEMGIDIGDLSAVFLASLPRTVASYLQRIGRAGRLTGNALNLAFVTGRGEHLPKLGDPLSVINGLVRPPATYLSAEEILRRQFTASIADRFARDASRPHPRKAGAAIRSADPGSFLGDVIAEAEQSPDIVEAFVTTFHPEVLDAEAVTRLRAWLTPAEGAGSSGLAQHLSGASHRWGLSVEKLVHREESLYAAVPDFEARAASPAATEEDKRAYRSARAALRLTRGQLKHLRGEHWISVLEEYGILPNYTLLDDTVVLDVGLSWTDPDTQDYQTEHVQLQRGAAQAIREFAPGATFYARGIEIKIDAVDLGMDGDSIRPWVFCPSCGFARDIGLGAAAEPVAQCPRCGSGEIADVRQQLEVVELTHVTAELRRDEAAITDRVDERRPNSFTVVIAPDIVAQEVGREWYVRNDSFGVKYLRSVEIRWINLGLPGHTGATMIAGVERPSALFRLCSGCGKLDTATGSNNPYEHRPWCEFRLSDTEHTRSVALSRTLRTQGLILRLPRSITIGDEFAVPSLSAALLLGLREQIGGYPDHIRVEPTVDPIFSNGADNLDALLLHDIVPGGTGYLADLADPATMRELLLTAWRLVSECECRDEDRLACHRCLLPFASGAAVPLVSRAAAERHLLTILTAGSGEDPEQYEWDLTEVPPQAVDPESYLEQKFRAVLMARLGTLGATLQETPGPWGNTVSISVPGTPRRWTLTPQLNLEGARPDFVLQCNDPNVPAVAIFTDGRRFHASPLTNRLADDAEKRAALRDAGRVVLAVSHQDVLDAREPHPAPASWYSAAVLGDLLARQEFAAAPGVYELLRQGPIEFLLDWVRAPFPADQERVARGVPLMLARNGQPRQISEQLSLAQAAADELVGEPVSSSGPSRRVAVWRSGTVAAAVESVASRVEIALVIDDRRESLAEAESGDWLQWLRLSNALALRDWRTDIATVTTVLSQQHMSEARQPVEPEPSLLEGLTPEWSEAMLATQTELERELVRALSAVGSLPAPTVGFETADGIPIDISWPAVQIAVGVYAMPAQDRTDLAAAGWRVVEPDARIIAALLQHEGAS